MTQTSRAGRCLCGAVRYTFTGEPTDIGWCCCRTCQRSVGAPAVAWATVRAGQLTTTGAPRWTRSSRRAERGFCGACGTSLFWRASDGRVVDVTLASLDEPAALAPRNTIYTADRQPWAPIDASLPAHAGPGPHERDEPDAVATLDWLADQLEQRGLAWRISGGLAARSYGADRPLADIDIEVEDDALPGLVLALAAYVEEPLHRHRSATWDLLVCTLNHHGQLIDLCGGSSCRIYDRHAAAWRDDLFDPRDVVLREIFGRRVPVVPCERLLAYKRALGRDVDLADIALIEAAGPT